MSIRRAAIEAKKSSFKAHRLGAVIVKGKRILSTGYNEIRYSKTIGKNTLHAEAAAIRKLLDRRALDDLVGSDLYVLRFTHAGRIGMARPCSQCMELIRSVGIHRVYFTQDDGSTGVIKV
jgi:deoxycytidylate deaminase